MRTTVARAVYGLGALFGFATAALLALIAAPLQAQQPRPGSLNASATGPTTVVLTSPRITGTALYLQVERM